MDRYTGRAVIFEENESRYYIIDAKKSLLPKSSAGVHLGMFLQPAMAKLEEMDAGEYPYREFAEYLMLAERQETCLFLLLLSVDQGLPRKYRRDSARLVNRFLEDVRIEQWIRERLVETPLPLVADIVGIPSRKLKQFIRSLSNCNIPKDAETQ